METSVCGMVAMVALGGVASLIGVVFIAALIGPQVFEFFRQVWVGKLKMFVFFFMISGSAFLWSKITIVPCGQDALTKSIVKSAPVFASIPCNCGK